MWRILILFSTFQLSNCACSPGFDLVNNECRGNYTKINTYWDVAMKDVNTNCQGVLAKIPIIHNSKDNDYWSGRAKTDGATYIITGLVCNSSSKKWEWVDGSPLDYKPPSYHSALNNTCQEGMSWLIQSTGSWSYGTGHSAYTFDLYCAAANRLPDPSGDGCESFEDDSEDGVCYQVGAPAEDWQEAQMICRSFGAEVASIHNQKENSFVRRLAVSKGAIDGLYLGAIKSGKGNEFGWVDGSTWDYDNFYKGFPASGLGDCLFMDTEGTSGLWANVDCSSKLSVACQRDHNYTSPSCTDGPWKEGQIIFSPGFPFDARTPCDYLLSVDPGKKVGVVVHFLEANPCCDSLTLVENYFGGNIIANLTGQLNDQTFVTSSSNYMRVSWQPNSGANVQGFMMTFRGV